MLASRRPLRRGAAAGGLLGERVWAVAAVPPGSMAGGKHWRRPRRAHPRRPERDRDRSRGHPDTGSPLPQASRTHDEPVNRCGFPAFMLLAVRAVPGDGVPVLVPVDGLVGIFDLEVTSGGAENSGSTEPRNVRADKYRRGGRSGERRRAASPRRSRRALGKSRAGRTRSRPARGATAFLRGAARSTGPRQEARRSRRRPALATDPGHAAREALPADHSQALRPR